MICEGCGTEVAASTGPRPRRWCSDACRKKTERARERDRAASASAGGVARAVRALVDGRGLEPGSYPAAIGELAVSQAAMADNGNANAAGMLRQTLADLDDTLGLVPPSEGDSRWFSILDVRWALTREGVDPQSAIGKALLADGGGGLISFYPPRIYTDDGEQEAFMQKHAGGPLDFWSWHGHRWVLADDDG